MSESRIEIDLGNQQLNWFGADGEMVCYPISSAKNGAGELLDSECTPRGKHQIEEKIGEGAATNTVFIGRQASGELYSKSLAESQPGRDWILTRILWLGGLEPGKNAGGKVDSKTRYIYIHGTPDETEMRTPGSRGCVRMRNNDVIDLFERVTDGTEVEIFE